MDRRADGRNGPASASRLEQAVIAAAALVYWLNSAWPDIIVAAVIAALFLHSAAEIIRDARRELREHA